MDACMETIMEDTGCTTCEELGLTGYVYTHVLK